MQLQHGINLEENKIGVVFNDTRYAESNGITFIARSIIFIVVMHITNMLVISNISVAIMPVHFQTLREALIQRSDR